MLHVHRAERADRLVVALADILADPPDDPFVPDLVAVHSRGIERWLAQELSTRLGTGPGGGDGVCANVRFPFPSRLLAGAVAEATGAAADAAADPWRPEHLTWPLLEVVEASTDDRVLGPLTPLRHGAGGAVDPEDAGRRVGAVRHIADLFDRYAVHRPGMVRAWADGDDVGADGDRIPSTHRWQPRLWRAVRDHVGSPSPAERLSAALTRLQDDPEAVSLPHRLALFGLTALPASYLAVVHALARTREVHLLALHPSPAWWDAVATVLRGTTPVLWPRRPRSSRTPSSTPSGARPATTPATPDPTDGLAAHPLLTSWARDARELQVALHATASTPPQVVHHPAPPADPRTVVGATHLLGRVQSAIHRDEPPPTAPHAARPRLDPADRSLQVHACHGRGRQVEVMRDAILHLLADDPTLEPRDVIVLCPDVEAFAPLIAAAFGTSDVEGDTDQTGLPRLRVRLADRSVRRVNPMLDVVRILLTVPDGRLGATEVLDLAGRGPVRRRFGFDDDDLDVLEQWVAGAGIRWGLDADHRARHGLPALDANTWRFGLDRLTVGAAIADEDARAVAGVVPYDHVEGDGPDRLGLLAELIARLGRVVTDLVADRTLPEWSVDIGRAVDALAATAPSDAWQRLQLHRILAELEQEGAVGASAPVTVSLAEVRRLLDDRLGGRPTTTGHRTGDLTICTLVPMRSVPHRVVGLLGLDDRAFPRTVVADGDDLLDLAPRISDRDPRSEDRQLLLDALLAATEAVVITYAGRDERTNERLPPAVAVHELLDVVAHTVTAPDGRDAREWVVRAHPLQGFDPRAFVAGALHPGRPWGFDRSALAGARAIDRAPRPPAPFVPDGGLEVAAPDVVDLDDLVAFLDHPVRAFVTTTLGIRLPGEDDTPSDSIPVDLAPLDRWKVGDALLAGWYRGADPSDVLDRLRRTGDLPPGDLAAAAVDDVTGTVGAITELCDRLDVRPGERRRYPVSIGFDDGRLVTGTVPGVELDRARVTQLHYSKLAARHRMRQWVHLLACTATFPEGAWEAVTVGRHPWKQGKVSGVRHLPRDVTADERRRWALDHLATLLDLHDRGRRQALPLYCKTSLKCAELLRAGDVDTRIMAKPWTTTSTARWDNEDRDPYHVLVLGDVIEFGDLVAIACDEDERPPWTPYDRRLFAYAWRLWGPVLDAERWCHR